MNSRQAFKELREALDLRDSYGSFPEDDHEATMAIAKAAAEYVAAYDVEAKQRKRARKAKR